MADVIRAVRRSARATARMAKHHRAVVDALQRDDYRAAWRAERLLVRARRDQREALHDARFPWEV